MTESAPDPLAGVTVDTGAAPVHAAGSVGLLQGSALYIAAVLGTGILVLPALAATRAGPASVLSVLAVLLLSIPLAGTFAALAARYPDAGGVATFVRLALGEYNLEARLAEERTWERREEFILLNPAAIVTWVVLMGPLIPKATHLDGVACAIGVFIGSFGWFSLVAYLTHRGKHVLGEKAAWIPRVIGVGLMLYAVYLIAKAAKYVLT